MKNKLRSFARKGLICAAVAAACLAALNLAMMLSVNGQIRSAEDAAAWAQEEAGGADCVLVLGAAVWDGKPSPMLGARLDAGLEAFADGASRILLLSGDNGTMEYNEVQAMKDYALEDGAAYGATAANIYLDYAGFSTYDSLYRCKEIFGAERVVIVTQRYHLYRALYIANRLGIEAVGVAAQDYTGGQVIRDAREILARTKDFFLCLTDYTPKVLGDAVPLTYPSTQNTPMPADAALDAPPGG